MVREGGFIHSPRHGKRLWFGFAALIRSTIFGEFMMFSPPVSVHQELSDKQKPPTHQGGGFIFRRRFIW
jgi:hypothetical protein